MALESSSDCAVLFTRQEETLALCPKVTKLCCYFGFRV